ncbi:MAG TPA: chromosome segregation protein SMC [Bacilli bacterium]|nr:chromosome segregation protein SMC [Bacilli bacterium]
MYLKEIRAHGFKSFADKINIELGKDITGIVGPNGSGKSNVVDAIRWVLGEQSIKSLRGTDNMTDVIFSGSKSRSPLNVSSVTLIFDNSDKYLNVAFNEVSIKRTVYRDGTNEYSLNGEKCRLKDITEILLDTGVAKESFNIISQGKIEEILSTKAVDRRVIFEEAAGVLKYKKRKEEALRKLERTHDNMNRVEDIIHELEIQVLPLKEQKEKALEYLDVKEELEKIEIALLAQDIKTMNDSYKEKKKIIEELKSYLLTLTTTNTGSEAKISELKNKLDSFNNKINLKQKELLDITTKVEKINSRKNIILERQKYNVDDSKIHTSLVDAKEKILKLENDIESIKNNILLKQSEMKQIELKFVELNNELSELKNKRIGLDNSLNNLYRRENNIKSKIESLKDQIDNNSLLPMPVKSILDNPKIEGIHNVIGSLIEVDESYSNAIAITLGMSASNIVVDSEMVAKECINYLKNNNLGRATFFPLNIIKPKAIDPDTLNIVKGINGFIDVASSLVKYDKKYYGIILNQLGNVIVANNIDNANIISKRINYKYRVVTLDGEMLHVGGSLTGGTLKNNRNVITLKYELDNLINEHKEIIKEIKDIEDSINIIDASLNNTENKLYIVNKDKINVNEEINSKNGLLEVQTNLLEESKNESLSLNNMLNNTLSKEEDEVLEEYYAVSKEKDLINNELLSLIDNRDSLKDKLEECEHSLKLENTTYNSKSKELNNYEIEVNRLDVKLDNMLNILRETYNITYEKAYNDYKLEIDIDVARNKVNTLRRKLKDIGMVNINAIEEYDKVSERYEFLINQREDLVNAENTLMEIIKDLDEVMKDDFIKTFKVIQSNFTDTFKELFGGGTASLKLTDPDNILETGVDIIAEPPGKKLLSISLLSGGEKTFTAISLLFAILKSRPVPFCILDEVEAALDEVNVDSFGKYLKKLAEKTQFIVITHKKKTMEYVNSLYGITMQESGVSKLVSVKLEDIK